MPKVIQLGIDEVSPISQYLLELPWMFGNDVWTGLGREETTEHPLDVPDTTHKDRPFIPHDGP